MIKIHTSYGVITLELDADKAPLTVANFTQYAKDGFYDGTIFHRIIKGFMVQGGGMESGMQEKSSGEPIKNEGDNGLKNNQGTIAMARTMDPHSATAQFFINLSDNDFLNHSAPTDQGWGYTVFGKVTDGMEVVVKLGEVKTANNGHHQDVPVEDALIEKVELL